MEKLVFNDYGSLAYKMLETADSGETAYAVCFFDDAVGLLKELMSVDEVSVGGIEIHDIDYEGYDKEYYVSIDEDYIVDVEPAWHEANEYCGAGYLGFEAANAYIDGDANSAILKVIDEATCYEIAFDISDEDVDFMEKLFDNAKIISDKDGEPVGIGIDVMSLICDLFGE